MKVYVASSWRNPYQQAVVAQLRDDGHEVYDFKNPGTDRHGSGWREIDPEPGKWLSNVPKFIERLEHPRAIAGFESDMNALKEADACVYVLPCGVSASWEAGYAVGAGKLTLVYIPELREPELMLKMAALITNDFTEVRTALREYPNRKRPD